MKQRTDYAVLALIVANTMILTALGAHVAGFELPPVVIFALLVIGSPISVVLGVLPAMGVRVPAVEPSAPQIAAPAPPPAAAEPLAPLHPAR